MKGIIAVDIGGTKMYGGVIGAGGKIVRTKQIPTHAHRKNSAIFASLTALIENLARDVRVQGVGLAIAGHVDYEQNSVAQAGPNFRPSFSSIDFAKDLSSLFHVPVVLENDAKAYALGEAVYGRGQGYERVVVLTVGTGIGGGIVFRGHVLRGKNNLAGEAGQMFTRGTQKTWEKIAAGPAFAGRQKHQKQCELLAEGIHNALHLLDPDVIIVGGGVATSPGFVHTIRQHIRPQLHYRAFKYTPILRAALLKNAPLLGMYTLLQEELSFYANSSTRKKTRLS